MAKESGNASVFADKLETYVDQHRKKSSHPAQSLKTLINNNNTVIHELSTEKDIKIQTITLLWDFLRGVENTELTEDFVLELYQQLELLNHPNIKKPSRDKVYSWMRKWKSGLSPTIIQAREKNKEHIIRLLVDKIEKRKSGKYTFPKGLSHLAKSHMVEQWWNDYKFHLAMAVRKPSDLNLLLDNTLSKETMGVLREARKKGIPTFATPYYLSLLNTQEKGYNDLAIRNYVIYSKELVETFGEIVAWEREDKIEPGKPNVAGWILPNAKNIHRRYPDVAILIPDTVGRACGGLCASCQRMYDFQRQHLNFDLDKLKPKLTWNQKLKSLMKYYEEDSQLRDILITGGDALMSQNKTIKNLLNEVYKMAVRKKKANLKRPDGKKYAEMQRIRLGTRLLAYLPVRVDDELIEILKDFKEKAVKIGFKQFLIQTHFQSPLEITPEAKRAIKKILSTGWSITNQLVFTVSASRRGHTAKLRRKLNKLGVICYYTFSVKGFYENYAVFAPNSRAIQKREEEKFYGNLTQKQEDALCNLFEEDGDVYREVRTFMKEHKLPFLATDRDVLNLPGIGKSMTYETIGITPDGRRILSFDHDHNRQHSPVIDNMEEVYIVESKSVGAYLRQLKEYGENPNHYSTIWYYTIGQTERRFKLYEYPEYDFNTTDKLTHFVAR